jgi:hypothetical protein
MPGHKPPRFSKTPTPDKDEVAGKRGQPKQDKGKVLKNVERLNERLDRDKRIDREADKRWGRGGR